ncbi:MAG: tRNA (adenosine(37)-N6)-threonylcarbamoyltransferase complex ATPase subunit type 1 TsaE [Muribaculaceae bacterium]|nr:tRNA (adenosine(37)-N6)-threonylcarbamoyltransferase complex ATPase subunit type 1 TsaE [Muribaculaceae bacterium]MDE6487632.1 tRNA (adenosine(37)-N6)-threonylcarbamoyltransferase complex ATPase subunit type 1 TsaE [Muribaculaceae bacterium]
MNEITFHISGLADLPAAADAIAGAMQAAGASVVAFDGEMGAGKTTLIRALVSRLGADGCDTANSPSFAIANDYGRAADGRNVFHFDLYRLESAAEAMDIGFEDYLDGDNICLVEWPDRAEELLPSDTLRVAIALLPDRTRSMRVHLPA